jgi:putative membrane protein
MRFSALRSRLSAESVRPPALMCGYNGQMTDPGEKDPRVYLAVERTYLAWIRTGIALMGVGFAVSRFGLFLRELSATEAHIVPIQNSYSVLSGVALVVLGVIINLAATLRHFQLVRELSSGTWLPGRTTRLAVILALVLAAIGIVLAVYLLVLRSA